MKKDETSATSAASAGSAMACDESATLAPMASSGGRETIETIWASLALVPRELLGSECSTPASTFPHQADGLDAHRAVDGLAHVVDGQRGDGHGRQRLHLHPGAVDG